MSETPRVARFTVDTHLFRELGELLVGRHSTALVELIKNAFDADAQTVTVFASNLDSPNKGQLVISDDGLGMTEDAFNNGFLRVAARFKEQGLRQSPRFKRRYTGEKGIGRLAAHKLARRMEIQSIAADPETLLPLGRLKASIDWDAIERAETLDSISADAITLTSRTILKGSRDQNIGTTITLTKLRQAWTELARARFIAEVQSFQPPRFFTDALPSSVLPKPLLFSSPRRSSQSPGSRKKALQFKVELLGDLEVGDFYWEAISETSDWVLEIDANANDAIQFAISPTQKWNHAHTPFKPYDAQMKHPAPETKLGFHARILLREGAPSNVPPDVRQFLRTSYGIHVYMEGFRVLPYGEPGNDWLEIDRDYARRTRTSDTILDSLVRPLGDAEVVRETANDPLTLVPNRQYLGAVFLTLDNSGHLKTLVNREGFLPDDSYYALTKILGTGLQLLNRVRAAANYELRKERQKKRLESAAKKWHEQTPEAPPAPPADSLVALTQRSESLAKKIQQQLASGNTAGAAANVDLLEIALAPATLLSREVRDEAAMIRVLASVGTQMAAFVHEVRGLVGLSAALQRAVEQIRDNEDLSRTARRSLSALSNNLMELRHRLERQAAYLTAVTSPDAKRRRSRQLVAKRLDSAIDLLRQVAVEKSVTVKTRIDPELRTRAMFGAELVALFLNLLTNAIKAAAPMGKILVSGRAQKDELILRFQNTGVAVRPEEGEQWFKPFVSSTANVDESLGKGMGLGLPISRRIVEEYGGRIHFINPMHGYATSIEVVLPN